MTRSILIVWNGPPNGTSANLFQVLGNFLAERFDVYESSNSVVEGGPTAKFANFIKCNVQRIGKLLRSDILVVHSYSALSLPTMVLARGLNRKVIVMHWDVYPTSIDGKRLRGGFRRVVDWIEWIATRLATTVVVPTDDFRPFVHHRNIVVIPLWPSTPNIPPDTCIAQREPEESIRIAFTGQDGPTRGLADAFETLAEHGDTQFEVHIFGSSSSISDRYKPAPNMRLIDRGKLDRGRLLSELRSMDFGLISLNPRLDQPGFPSKVFDYVAADLPVIYFGRPLSAFVALLERTGVGMKLGQQPLDWVMLRKEFRARWACAKPAFEAETRLEWSKVEKIL